MKQLTVVLKRHHFPEKLDQDSVYKAFWAGTCIMEKAVDEQHPDLDYTYISPSGHICVGVLGLFTYPIHIGSIEGEFHVTDAYAIAKQLETDPNYTQSFTINIH